MKIVHIAIMDFVPSSAFHRGLRLGRPSSKQKEKSLEMGLRTRITARFVFNQVSPKFFLIFFLPLLFG